MEIRLSSNSREETMLIGKKVAKHLWVGSVLTLSGDLGAGKTTFTKGVGLGLGITEPINSPTFNILKCYFNEPLTLYHIDAYRLEDVNPENKDIGLEEVIEGDGVCLIEWPMYIEEFIPEDVVNVEIYNKGENDREIIFKTTSDKYNDLFNFLREYK